MISLHRHFENVSFHSSALSVAVGSTSISSLQSKLCNLKQNLEREYFTSVSHLALSFFSALAYFTVRLCATISLLAITRLWDQCVVRAA